MVSKTIKARFRNGIIEPLEKMELKEGGEFTLTIVRLPEISEDIMPKDKIPESLTLEEAAEFWDEHSTLDYDDVQDAHFSVDLRKNRNYVDLSDPLAKEIRMIAHERGVSPRVLINRWLREKVVTEQRSET